MVDRWRDTFFQADRPCQRRQPGAFTLVSKRNRFCCQSGSPSAPTYRNAWNSPSIHRGPATKCWNIQRSTVYPRATGELTTHETRGAARNESSNRRGRGVKGDAVVGVAAGWFYEGRGCVSDRRRWRRRIGMARSGGEAPPLREGARRGGKGGGE